MEVVLVIEVVRSRQPDASSIHAGTVLDTHNAISGTGHDANQSHRQSLFCNQDRSPLNRLGSKAIDRIWTECDENRIESSAYPFL
jgi:hypothetical protein